MAETLPCAWSQGVRRMGCQFEVAAAKVSVLCKSWIFVLFQMCRECDERQAAISH